MYELSEKQSNILGFIEGCQRDGYTPTLQEIADKLEMRSISGVWYQIRQLQAKGYLEIPKSGRIIVS